MRGYKGREVMSRSREKRGGIEGGGEKKKKLRGRR